MKTWPDQDRAAGIFLTCFGTIPDPVSICADSHQRALEITRRILQNAFDSVVPDDVASDIRFVAAKISEALKECNRRVRSFGLFLGEGIYIAGCVIYYTNGQYFAVSFGGIRAYLWNGENLIPLVKEHNKPYVMDALGSVEAWTGSGKSGQLKERWSIIAASEKIPDLKKAEEILSGEVAASGHPRINALLLQKILADHYGHETAVFELANK